MIDHLWQLVQRSLGIDVPATALTAAQMAWRALVVMAWSILLLKLAPRRFLGRNSGADIMLAVMLGSVLSRAINGQAAFFATLGVSAVLILLHRGLMTAAFHFHWFSLMIKGRDTLLVRQGRIDWAAMRATKITEDDLLENLRINGNTAEIADVAEARLERSGAISMTKPATPPEQ